MQELETVDSLNGVNSLPGVKGKKVVSVPMELLEKPAKDAAAKAETAASYAESTAKQAESSAMVAEGAAETAHAAAEAATAAAGKANEVATSYEGTAKAALKGATARFSRIIESGTINPVSVANITEVVYIKNAKKFAGAYDGGYCNNWMQQGGIQGADMFMDDTRSSVLKDKIYVCGDTLYAWSEEEGDLVKAGGGGSGSGFYNVTQLHPLGTGYYTLETAVAALAGADIDDDDKRGMIITIETGAGKWKEYRFEGTDTSSFLTASAWNRYGGADAIKKITVTRGTASEEHTADEQGGVTIDIPVMEVDQSVNENSTNAVSGKAVSAAINEKASTYGTALQLNEIGEGTDKAYSLSLLNEAGEVISTSDMFTGGGGGTVATTKVVLTRVTPNKTVKAGDEVKLTYTYDQTDTATGESTGNPGRATVTVTQGANTSTLTQTISAGSTNTVDVTKYMGVGTNTVRVRVEVGEGAEMQVAQVTWSINVVQLTLSSSFNIATAITRGQTVSIPYALSGAGTKTLRCYVDGDPALLCGRHGHRGQEHHQLDGQRVFQHSDDQPGAWHPHGAARGGAGTVGRQHHQVEQHPLRRGRQGSREQHPAGVRKVRLCGRVGHRKWPNALHPDEAVRQLHAAICCIQPQGNPDTGGRICRERRGAVPDCGG